MDTAIRRLELSLYKLHDRMESPAYVVLPNQQGLDFVFISQGGVCTMPKHQDLSTRLYKKLEILKIDDNRNMNKILSGTVRCLIESPDS